MLVNANEGGVGMTKGGGSVIGMGKKGGWKGMKGMGCMGGIGCCMKLGSETGWADVYLQVI